MIQDWRKAFFVLLLISAAISGTIVVNGETDSQGSLFGDLTQVAAGNLSLIVSSEDQVLTESNETKGTVYPLNNSSKYVFINDQANDGNTTEGFQSGDDAFVVRIVVSGTNISSNNSSYFTFPSNVIFIDDPNIRGNLSEFDRGDDIFEYRTINGNPSMVSSGITYTTFQNSTKYLSVDGSRPESSAPIIASNDSKLDSNDIIIQSSSTSLLQNLNGTKFQTIDDTNGKDGYSTHGDGKFGEPIYNSGGDGVVNSSEDTRITDIRIYSSTDYNVSTLDLGLDNFTTVQNGDQDIGIELSNLAITPTINEIDPDGSNNSPVGRFGPEDTIVIDVTGDDSFQNGSDLVIFGAASNGTVYDAPNLTGTWKNGLTTKGDAVIFDRNNDGSTTSDLLQKVVLKSAPHYIIIPLPQDL